jgi:hypothetical protein
MGGMIGLFQVTSIFDNIERISTYIAVGLPCVNIACCRMVCPQNKCLQECSSNCKNPECENGCANKCASPCEWKCKGKCFIETNPSFLAWLIGFTYGEGCFYFNAIADKSMRLKKRVAMVFKITQNFRDIKLLYMIRAYFNCGYVYNSGDKKNSYNYEVKNFNDLSTTIVPFFVQNPLLTKKMLDFQDFKTVVDMRVNNEHLTIEGLNKVQKLAENTNKTRKFPFTPKG